MASIGAVVAKVTANITDFSAKMSEVVKKGADSSSKVSKSFQGVGKVFSTIGKTALGAIAGVSTAIVGITAASVKAYADYEQMTGGVVKLFGDASTEVIANAEKAYRTAGMSANDYMETVTGFSASLLQSLGGDTVEATRLSDQAIQDMSDNANIFGTDIRMIKDAYQGFAKQNFMMLDNLKLGYGGTAGEMARLINDTKVMGDTFVATAENVKDIGFDKYIEAIHIVQEETNITGTTAKEASETITGSINSAKGAWQNLLVAFASNDIDVLSVAIDNLSTSLGDVFTNLAKIIPEILSGIVKTVEQVFTNIDFSSFLLVIYELVPKIINLAKDILVSLVTTFKDNLPVLIESALLIIDTLIRALIELIPLILETGIKILIALMEGLTETIPELIPLIVDMIMLMVDTIVENLPLIIESGVELIIAIIMGLVEALPLLIPIIVDMVLLMVKTLIENLPLIIQAGSELIIALLMGIIEALPQLISYMPELIDSIVEAIMLLLPIILILGIRIILELNKGMVVAIPQLVAMIPQIIMAIAGALVDGFPAMVKTGKELIGGLWEGILSSKTWIKNKLSSWVGDVTSFLKKLFGIASPSKVMEDEVGLNIGSGIASGILKSIKLVEDAMGDVDHAVSMAVSPTISPNIAGAGLGGGGISVNVDMSGANISSPEIAQDYAEKIGDAIVGKLRTTRRSYG
jgi:phage-related protein